MGIEIESLKGITGGWNSGRPCDSCKSDAASAFCKAESAFFCLSCDSKHHKLMVQPRHERVWLCEVCEQAPAAVTCKADAAALCVACDADIHSANPLARRHERVPIEPFFDSAAELIAKSTSSSPFGFLVPTENFRSSGYTDDLEELFTSTPIPPPVLNSKPVNFGNSPFGEMKSGDPLVFFPEMDAGTLLDFEYQNFTANGAGNDSVVPVQIKPEGVPIISQEINSFDIDFSRSKLSPLSYVSPQSISHSVSSSSVDVGVVPDGSSMSEISHPFLQNMTHSGSDAVPNGATLSSSATSGLDREARVLRYREKRKNRKFEKTIRYASRKAYAETRPRIKGRFAKRTETEPDLGQDHHRVFSPPSSTISFVGADTQYGVVPIF